MQERDDDYEGLIADVKDALYISRVFGVTPSDVFNAIEHVGNNKLDVIELLKLRRNKLND